MKALPLNHHGICDNSAFRKHKINTKMVNAKHLATFIMGAAAGVALNQYLQTEEGQKLAEDIKAKASELKTQAEETIDKAPEYFEQLKTQGADLLKQFPEAEKLLHDLMGKTAQ